jgi:hypothetical protein
LKENCEVGVVAAGVSSFWPVSVGLEKENGEGDGPEGADVFGADTANGLLAAGMAEVGELPAAVPLENIEEKGFGLMADGAGVGFTVTPLENMEEKGLGEGPDDAGVLLAAGAVGSTEAKGFAGVDV